MRTLTINGVTVTYPNDIIYADDENWVEFSGSGALGEVGVTLSSVYQPAQVLLYTSPTDRLRMNLSSALLPHIENAGGVDEVEVTLFFTVRGAHASKTVRLRYGRTLSTRTHFAEGTILYPKNSLYVNIYIPYEGGVTVNGVRSHVNAGTITMPTTGVDSVHIDLISGYQAHFKVVTSGAPDEGHVYELTVTNNTLAIDGKIYDEYSYEDYNGDEQLVYILNGVPSELDLVKTDDGTIIGAVVAVLVSSSTIDRAELGYFATYGISEWDVKLQSTCAKEHAIVIGYNNTDGVWREVCGELMTGNISSEGETMHRVKDVRRHESWRHINTVQQIITVGFWDIPHDAYIEDMLTSWSVVVKMPNGAKIPAVPVTKKLGGIDGSNITIELEVLS